VRHADIFASEYSALLARRLLEKTTFDIEDELKKVIPPPSLPATIAATPSFRRH
jgi:hypothetical protein